MSTQPSLFGIEFEANLIGELDCDIYENPVGFFSIYSAHKISEKLYDHLINCNKQSKFKNINLVKKDSVFHREVQVQKKDTLSEIEKIYEDYKSWNKNTAPELMLEKIKSHKGRNFLTDFYQIVGLAMNSNFSTPRSIIERWSLVDPKIILFDLTNLNLNKIQRLELKLKIIEMLEALKAVLKPNLFSNLSMFIANYLPEIERKEFESNFKIDFSKNTIREKIKSPNFGLNSPAIWVPVLIKRGNQLEINDYIQQVFNFFNNKKIEDLLWLIEFYIPTNKNLREMFAKHLEKKLSMNDLYTVELLNILLKNQGVLNLLKSEIKNFAQPNFSSKRQIYQDCLKRNDNMKNYCIYSLFGMGDLDPNYQSMLEVQM